MNFKYLRFWPMFHFIPLKRPKNLRSVGVFRGYKMRTSAKYWLSSSDLAKLKFSKLRFSKSKNIVSRSVYGEVQVREISLNFKYFNCNLKIRGLGAKWCLTFPLF